MRSLRPLVAATIIAAFFFSMIPAAPAAAQGPSPSTDEVLFAGSWDKKTQKIAGTWSIVRDGKTRTIRLDKKFKTKGAPDLKIILSPLASDKLTNKNAMGKSVVISLLKSPKGAQSYRIPEKLDLSKYRSIAIHCEQYTKLWGAAPLAKPKPQPKTP